jgi:hypothetical protein
MPYAYYARLNKANKAVYRRSEAVERVALHEPRILHPAVRRLEQALAVEHRAAVELAARELTDGLLADLGLAPVTLKVLAVRPSHDWGELHGLYERPEGRGRARISVWMRTARHKRTVAFRTFLRTILHEICHHLDYELLQLQDSFHTQGFFKRESSLFHQLVVGSKS